jgi:phenylacetic acid degradation operon negative regulatory protein
MSAVTSKIFLKFWFGNGDNQFTIEDIVGFFKKDEQAEVRLAIKDLKRYDFIAQKKNYEGSVLISLSEKGKLRALNYAFRRLETRREKWDGKWRMVSFDIPNQYTKGRKALVYRLKSGGFYELQNSFFIYPYDCEREIKMLVNLFKIEKYIIFGLLESLDNQDVLIRHFKLNND